MQQQLIHDDDGAKTWVVVLQTGHLLEGHVRPTLEVMVTETPAHLHRSMDPESGLALIRPGLGAGASAKPE